MITAHRRTHALTSVIILLQSLLPVSHITMLAAPGASPTFRDQRGQLEQVLRQTFTNSTNGLTVIDPAQTLTSTLPVALRQMLADIAAGRRSFIPWAIAPFPTARRRRMHGNSQPAHVPASQPPTERIMRGDALFNTWEHRRLCTIRLDGQHVTGIVCGRYADDGLILRVVYQANTSGIQWQLVRVRAAVPRHLWPPQTMLLLPMLSD